MWETLFWPKQKQNIWTKKQTNKQKQNKKQMKKEKRLFKRE